MCCCFMKVGVNDSELPRNDERAMYQPGHDGHDNIRV